MRLVRRDDGDRATAAVERFTGHVELEMLHEAGSDDRPDVAHVHFHDGAVTNWHVHPGGQHLYVASGTARVGTDADGEVELGPGDLVVSPAGERHWHGAGPGHDATILAVTWGTTQWEPTAPDLA
jgi:quercetin dioxygenase-like cupin family protein